MDVAITLVMLVPVLLAVALIIGVIRRNITERQAGDPVDISGAIPAVIVLMVAVLLIGGMAESVEDRDYELYDCVPLSSFASDATIDGDCAEIVTIGGTQYVKMTDLGTFKVTAAGKEKEYRVKAANLDLVLLTGQSNSAAYTSPSNYSGDSPVAPGKAFYLGTATGGTIYGPLAQPDTLASSAIWDVTADSGAVRIAQMYPQFCKDYITETGHRVLVVNTGIVGKSISAWDDGEECDLWMESVFGRLGEILLNGKVKVTPTVALWSQGEADVQQTEAFYTEHLMPLLERLWDGDYGYAFKTVLSVVPRHPSYDNPIAPARAQMEIASENRGFDIASTLPIHMTADQTRDGIHYTQEVYGWLGEAFARSAAAALGRAPVSQTIVMVEDVGTVGTLPSKATSYGTSGQTFELPVAWTETSTQGTYTGALSGNPPRTTILAGLTASAILREYAWDPATGELRVYKNVSATSNPWDAYASDVREVYVEDGVTSVSGRAFSDCAGLDYVFIADTVSTIGSSAFPVTARDMEGASVQFKPGEFIVYEGYAYYADPAYYSFSGSSITGLASGASPDVLAIPSVNGSQTVSSIADMAFYSNSGVTTVLTNPNVAVGMGAFMNMSSLTDAKILRTTYGGAVFRDDPQLVDVELYDGIEEIAVGMFTNCTSLDVAIPSTVKTLGTSAFGGCTSLTSANLVSAETIGNAAFYNCVGLTSLAIPAAKTIGTSAFLTNKFATLTIPASLTSIGTDAFKQASLVTSITFEAGFSAEIGDSMPTWTFYDSDGTTELAKTAANLAGHTFAGTYRALVKQS